MNWEPIYVWSNWDGEPQQRGESTPTKRHTMSAAINIANAIRGGGDHTTYINHLMQDRSAWVDQRPVTIHLYYRGCVELADIHAMDDRHGLERFVPITPKRKSDTTEGSWSPRLWNAAMTISYALEGVKDNRAINMSTADSLLTRPERWKYARKQVLPSKHAEVTAAAMVIDEHHKIGGLGDPVEVEDLRKALLYEIAKVRTAIGFISNRLETM